MLSFGLGGLGPWAIQQGMLVSFVLRCCKYWWSFYHDYVRIRLAMFTFVAHRISTFMFVIV